jgi:hypothetical protein
MLLKKSQVPQSQGCGTLPDLEIGEMLADY